MYFLNGMNQLTDVTYEYASGGELRLSRKIIDQTGGSGAFPLHSDGICETLTLKHLFKSR